MKILSKKMIGVINQHNMAHFKKKESFMARAAEEARRRLLKKWRDLPEPKESFESFKMKNWPNRGG